MCCVALDEGLLVLGNVVNRENRVRGADRHACAAVDTLCRIDKKLSGFLESRLILFGVNAVGGAYIDAKGIFNTGIGNYIGHGKSSPKMKLIVCSNVSIGVGR